MKTKFTRISSILLAVMLLVAFVPMQALALDNGGAGGSEAGELQWICVSGTHSWDDGVVTTAATCTGTGVRTFTCTLCGQTKTENISAIGHSWGDWTVTTPATCGNPGEKTRVCANDPTHVEVEVIAATGVHVPSGELIPATEPTCTENGSLAHYICSQCGANVDGEGNLLNVVVPATGHTWVAWQAGDDISTFELKSEATSEAAAVYYKKCSVDGVSAHGIDNTQTFTYGNPLPAFVYGDANGNGAVDASDAVLLAQYFANLVELSALAGGADANGNGAVDASDAVLLAQYFANIIDLDGLGPQS